MPITTNVLEIILTTTEDIGTTRTIDIADFNTETADAVIKTQVNAIVASTAFITGGGMVLDGIKSVKRITRNVTAVDMSA